MAYENFKPLIWSKYIMRELEKNLQLVDGCWKQFEGEAKQGGQVKITGIGKVTIGKYVSGQKIGSPEVISDSSVILPIDQARFYNFEVDDVDRAQSIPGVMEAAMDEAARAMAEDSDKFVASLANNPILETTASTAITTSKQAKTAIDDGILFLRENDVPISGSEVFIEIAPFMYKFIKDELVVLSTNNTDLIRKGIVGMYDNCKVRLCNNLYNDGTDNYMMIRTRKAIAYADGIDKTEAYRPEESFADAVKGLHVYGAKVVRPKELYVIRAHR